MATTATWTAVLVFAGDDTATKSYAAAVNQLSPAYDILVNLSSGNNTFTAPAAGTVQRVTLVPPAGNTVALTLKGVNGDTGLPLHLTDPTSLALASSVTQLVLNAASTVNGFRIVWS